MARVAPAKVAKKPVKEEKYSTAVISEYKGKRILQLWDADEDGNTKGKAPMMAFGLSKARLLIEHMEDIEDFVEEMAEEADEDDE